MNKEELEHNHIKEISENYVNESWGSYLDLDEVDLVMAGIGVAKIISKEKEKRIEELEERVWRQTKKISDLEKENAELKEKLEELKPYRCINHYNVSEKESRNAVVCYKINNCDNCEYFKEMKREI